MPKPDKHNIAKLLSKGKKDKDKRDKIEKKIIKELATSKKDLDESLVEMYDTCVSLKLVPKRA